MATTLAQKPSAAKTIQEVRDEIAWRNGISAKAIGVLDLREDTPLERRLRDTNSVFTRAEEVLKNPHSSADRVHFAITDMQNHIAMYHRRREFGYVMAFAGWYGGLINKSPHFE